MSSQSGVKVLIPTPLRRFTGGEGRVEISGSTVNEVLDGLEAMYPGIGERLRDDSGQIRRFVNVFVNGKNIRDGDGAETALSPGDEVGIIPAMAGGTRRLNRPTPAGRGLFAAGQTCARRSSSTRKRRLHANAAASLPVAMALPSGSIGPAMSPPATDSMRSIRPNSSTSSSGNCRRKAPRSLPSITPIPRVRRIRRNRRRSRLLARGGLSDLLARRPRTACGARISHSRRYRDRSRPALTARPDSLPSASDAVHLAMTPATTDFSRRLRGLPPLPAST